MNLPAVIFVSSVAMQSGSLGCARTRPAMASSVSQKEWTLARRRLESLRALAPRAPYTALVHVWMRGPARTFEARGALAVSPEAAARMILLGPGGTTALDMWITRDRWRLVIPPAGYRRAGMGDAGGARGAPIRFLRWWLLAPLSGHLLTCGAGAHASFVLRDGEGIVEIAQVPPDAGADLHLVASRRDLSTDRAPIVEHLDWQGRTLAPSAGDRARYEEVSLGLRLDLYVEEISPGTPDPRAFVDPDADGTPL